MEVVYVLRRLMEYYGEGKKDLHMIFIGLKKAHRRVNQVGVRNKRYSSEIHQVIKDKYNEVSTLIRTTIGETREFPDHNRVTPMSPLKSLSLCLTYRWTNQI